MSKKKKQKKEVVVKDKSLSEQMSEVEKSNPDFVQWLRKKDLKK